MSTTYTSTIEVNVWKEHTCVTCGTKYRYLFKRTKQGQGATPDVAATNAHHSVVKALEHEVDMQPCPGCGTYQPDMIASQRSGRHWITFWLTVPVVGLILLFACFDVFSTMTAAWLLGIFTGVTVLIHLLFDVIHPNANTAVNLELAQRREADGDLWLPHGIKQNNGPSVGSGIGGGHYIAYALLSIAMMAFVAPAVLLFLMGGKLNPAWSPAVMGPGDEGYIYFDTRVNCVGGRWRGSPQAVIVNWNELGIQGPVPQLSCRSRQDNWGDQIRIGRGSRSSSALLYAYVTIPNHTQR
jgi:hypothetical protein